MTEGLNDAPSTPAEVVEDREAFPDGSFRRHSPADLNVKLTIVGP